MSMGKKLINGDLLFNRMYPKLHKNANKRMKKKKNEEKLDEKKYQNTYAEQCSNLKFNTGLAFISNSIESISNFDVIDGISPCY